MIETIGVVGAGTMGIGIAQIAAQNKHQVILYDHNEAQLEKSKSGLEKVLNRLVEKERISDNERKNILTRVLFTNKISELWPCGLVIEAIIESIQIKHEVFASLEDVVSEHCILATNTSSLSIASIGAALKTSERVIGIHFFNPAPLMPLVEIIPAIQTAEQTTKICKDLIAKWGKTVVLCKDTPGFIVNRVARPFYGEALRIYEEGIADFVTIDWALTEKGGFRMGPFTLMDYIGNDVNFAVTESVFKAFFYDPRFKPSLTQKRYAEAGFFGRKSGRGYYDYENIKLNPKPQTNDALGERILNRILCLLVNEAIDAVFMGVASIEDVDLAMTKGVNYPKGLLKWGDEIGLNKILNQLQELFDYYGEDRYRPNPLLRKMVEENKQFYP
ncbi:MAG: 3-hydroxybutyryl-CoA dehydrogenase [Cryomorphaceae bacterium]|nr:3-hydroxybutyryl-CoA dehydrogenase [Cryomorphaceae bacterium]|tara:strand:- start:9489 stop:10652 length:1164 start_codon:yes stop_codon:yes gene_type:complete